MTRDQKLALIVGFSVVLLVGVLISDHFSRARQVRVSGVTPGEPVRLASTDRTNRPEPVTAEPWSVKPTAPAPSRSTLWPETAVPIEPASETAKPATSDLAASAGAVTESLAPRQGLDSGLRVEGQNRPVLEEASARAASLASEMARTDATRESGSEALIGEIQGRGGTVETQNGETVFTLHQNRKPEPGSDVLPSEKGSAALAGKAPTDRSLEIGVMREHTVGNGETMAAIAERYYQDKLLWKKLAAFNKSVVKPDGTVRLGAKLRIPPVEELRPGAPTKSPSAAPAPAPRSKPISPAITGPSVQGTLASATPPKSSPKVEKKPTKPDGKAVVAKTSRPKTYTVRKGDTLGKIAARVLGSSKRADELLEANGDKLDDEDSIEAGMVLRVPQA